MVCGSTKSKNKTEDDFKLWKESKLESIIHHVEYPLNDIISTRNKKSAQNNMTIIKNIANLAENTSKRSITTFQLKDDRIDSSSNEVLENVVKKFERDVDDEKKVKTDEGTLFGSYKDVNEHSIKHADRHIDHEGKDHKNFVVEGYAFKPQLNYTLDDNKEKRHNEIKEHLSRHVDRHLDKENESIPSHKMWPSSRESSKEQTEGSEHSGNYEDTIFA